MKKKKKKREREPEREKKWRHLHVILRVLQKKKKKDRLAVAQGCSAVCPASSWVDGAVTAQGSPAAVGGGRAAPRLVPRLGPPAGASVTLLLP